METLEQRYQRLCKEPSDIYEHLPVLYDLARQCKVVVEFGIRGGVSTTALLYAQPDRLTCVDKHPCPCVHDLSRIAGRTKFNFVKADTRYFIADPCDLLFVDTLHTYEQVRRELAVNAGAVSRWIVLHDTELFGENGEHGERGIWPAVEGLLKEGQFVIAKRLTNNNGLTILERKCAL